MRVPEVENHSSRVYFNPKFISDLLVELTKCFEDHNSTVYFTLNGIQIVNLSRESSILNGSQNSIFGHGLAYSTITQSSTQNMSVLELKIF